MPAPDSFVNAYMQTALWSSTNDRTDAPLDETHDWATDIAPETVERMRASCDMFYDANTEALNCDGVTYGPDFDQDGRAGHDFWLTRNGHGAGFWDGDWPEPQATTLTDAAHSFGEVDLYVGADGMVHAA